MDSLLNLFTPLYIGLYLLRCDISASLQDFERYNIQPPRTCPVHRVGIFPANQLSRRP